MTWDDFQADLKRNKLTQVSFSEMTGYSEQVISRWRHRVNGVPRWVATWLRMYRGGRNKLLVKT